MSARTQEPRRATPDDRSSFLSLWHQYLTEMLAKGSEILPTERTMDFYASVFDSYVDGSVVGIAAVVDGSPDSQPFAVSMAGDCTPNFDSMQGRTAIGWGTFVAYPHRGHGHADALRGFLIEGLRGLGLVTLLGSVQANDQEALNSMRKVPGAALYQHVFARRLQ